MSVDLLAALLEHPDMAANLKDRLTKVPKAEADVMMGNLLDKAKQEQEWGVPAILEALLTFCEADPSQGTRLAAFLTSLPPTQIQPSIVPKIKDAPWAQGVFAAWHPSKVAGPVTRAIKKA
jgi:predicted KAP-like P-loop ATPase